MVAATESVKLQMSEELQAQFLALVPKIERHAKICFAWITCPATKADRIAECVALAWKWHRRLAERGKDISSFAMVFVFLVAKAVKCGRRLNGQETANDVFSRRAQQRHNFTVERLPMSTATDYETLFSDVNGQRKLDIYEERLVDNRRTPVPDQAAFRIDFREWLATLTPRERRLIKAMAVNERTKDISRQFDLSEGRVSQMRREFKEGWERYCGESDTVAGAAVA